MTDSTPEVPPRKGSAMIGILMIVVIVVAIAILIFKKNDDYPEEPVVQQIAVNENPQPISTSPASSTTTTTSTTATTDTSTLSTSDDPNDLESDLNKIDVENLDSDSDNWE